MGNPMKTTIEIADTLLKRAKRIQKRDEVTLRSLVEEGLRLVLDRAEKPKVREYQPVVYGDGGLTAEARGKGWSWIIEQANER